VGGLGEGQVHGIEDLLQEIVPVAAVAQSARMFPQGSGTYATVFQGLAPEIKGLNPEIVVKAVLAGLVVGQVEEMLEDQASRHVPEVFGGTAVILTAT
jgi:hypothetical protein